MPKSVGACWGLWSIILTYCIVFFLPLNISNHGFSLCLQASKGCQNKEQILQQRFRRAFKDFQQWLVNAKITTAKCFDIPQNINEVSTSLQKIQVRAWSNSSNYKAFRSYFKHIKVLLRKFRFQTNLCLKLLIVSVKIN